MKCPHAAPVTHETDAGERLFQEYAALFRGFDNLTLARWMAQTLGQLQGHLWRMSHPLVVSYQLAAMVGHERQVWHQRLVDPPFEFSMAECCRAPLVPVVSRGMIEGGLLCLHCGDIAVPFAELENQDQAALLSEWAKNYDEVHSVAHWDETRKESVERIDQALENAAQESERRLGYLGLVLAPPLVEHYPTVMWMDEDECLQVRPEDIAV